MSERWAIILKNTPEVADAPSMYYGGENRWFTSPSNATIYPSRDEAEKEAVALAARERAIGDVGVQKV